MYKFDSNEKSFIIESFKKVYTPNDDGHPVYKNGKVTEEDFIKNLTQELNEKFNTTRTSNDVRVCWSNMKAKYMREKDEKPYKWSLMNKSSFLDDASKVNAEQDEHQTGAIVPSSASDSVTSEDESLHGLEESISSLSPGSSTASSPTISQQQSSITGENPQSNTINKLNLALEGVEKYFLCLKYVNKELSSNLENLERAIIRINDAIKEVEIDNSTSNAVIPGSRITQESLNYEVCDDACRSEGLDSPTAVLNDNNRTHDDDSMVAAGVDRAIARAGVDGRLRVVLQNISSMRTNFYKFRDAFKKNNWKPDVICLTEVWIGDDELHEYPLPSFNMFPRCNNLCRAGGVIIYTRNNLSCTQSEVNFKTADCVHVTVTCDDIAYDFLCIYRPHRKQNKSLASVKLFLKELNDYLSTLSCSNLYVLGDININILNLKSSRKYEDMMRRHRLVALVREPTRTTATCIDHVYFSDPDGAGTSRAEVIHAKVTDHSTVLLLID